MYAVAMDQQDKEEIERLIQVLALAMRILGVSNREVERRIGLSPSYLSRLFSGLIELRVEHVLAISRTIGLRPAEIFAFAYPQRGEPPSEAAVSIHKAMAAMAAMAGLAPPSPASQANTLSDAELDRKIQEAVRKALAEREPET
ncbi:MAG TPA: helix-turn-helix transcriptional regulator [Thermoanaerobaculia bacterium]